MNPDALGNFDLMMLGEVRIRKIATHKLNPGSAERLLNAGLIQAWDLRGSEPAHHSSTMVAWRITDEGLKTLGKERVW